MFEVVLALFVITMIIVAVVILSTNSISNSLFSKNKTLASRYSQEAVEWLRSERENNFNNFSQFADTPTYCLDGLNFLNTGLCSSDETIPDTTFERVLYFTKQVSSGKTIIDATVVTTWNDSKGVHSSRSVTSFSDIRER